VVASYLINVWTGAYQTHLRRRGKERGRERGGRRRSRERRGRQGSGRGSDVGCADVLFVEGDG